MRPTAIIHPQHPKQHPEQIIPQQQFPVELMFFEFPMADIAMMVADEEFERRLERGAPGGDVASKGQANFAAVTKVWGSWVESAAAAASGVKVHVALLVAEPKTPLALAAFNGFFSA